MKHLCTVKKTAVTFFKAVVPARFRDNGFFSVICLAMLLCKPLVVHAGYEDDVIHGAMQGDAQAQYALALLYEYGGETVSKNHKKSVQYLRQAAHKQVAGACLYLGLKYEHGNGVAQDYKKAICYYLCAARQDWPMAQFFLADFYIQGKGVKKSELKALAWLGLAREHGYPKADIAFVDLQKQLKVRDFNVLTAIQKKLMKKVTESCN